MVREHDAALKSLNWVLLSLLWAKVVMTFRHIQSEAILESGEMRGQ